MRTFLRWFTRILLGLLGLILVTVLLVAGFIIWDANFGIKTSDFSNISYSDDDGTNLIAYLAQPDEPGPHPAVLLIHEWWGLNEGITILADALAEQGYVVLAVDAYRGRVTNASPRALYLRLSTPQEQIFNDVDAGLNYLLGLENVDPERTASMGFCFGGGQSLQLGMRQSEKLTATIIYYGTLVTDPERLQRLTASQPVLGVFGEEDQQVLVQDVIEFEAALNSLDIENQITIYPNVGHAFLNEDNYNEPGAAGDAWLETLQFLEANVKGAE